MSFEFKLPDLGEGIHEAEVLQVKVTEGQSVAEDAPLFEVETDKAVVEIPSPVAGKVLKVYVKAGQIVRVGTVMVAIEDGQSTVIKGPTKPSSLTVAPTRPGKEAIAGKPFSSQIVSEPKESVSNIIATPATRQLARELKIDLHLIAGTGPGGRISKEDVLAYAEKQKGKSATTSDEVPIVLPDFKKYGPIKRIPMRSVRRKTAQLMSLSWSKIPHVTHCDEVDVTKLEKLKRKHEAAVKEKGGKLSLTVFVVKAVAMALQDFPQFNASYDESTEEIILKDYYNIGLAVATERGLIVPVLMGADKKSTVDLAAEISHLVEKTRSGKIELEKLQGGTFTITNIGAIGGTNATPIISYPEAAILAVMHAKERAIVKDGNIEAALIMPLSLAFDHRLADGAEAANFVRRIITILEEPSELVSKVQLGIK